MLKWGLAGLSVVLLSCSGPFVGCSSTSELTTADLLTETIMLPGNVPLEMVWIEPGTFMMGRYSGAQDSNLQESPQHQVRLTQGFWMGKYELTKRQWTAVMGTTPWSGKRHVLNDPDSPAVYVSWNDAQAFITALNGQIGKTFRLPTEAEREYAHVVGLKRPNAWNLYDMSGNVWELCGDWYADDYDDVGPATDPTGALSGTLRVNHGGSWDVTPQLTRIADRYWNTTIYLNNFLGLRLARTIP